MKNNYKLKTYVSLFLFSFVILVSQMKAQVNTYTFSSLSVPYADLVGSTASTAVGDDGTQFGITLPFTFNYAGNNVTAVGVGTNGWLRMGTSTTIGTFGAFTNSLNAPANNVNFVAPLWDDLNITGGTISYMTTGTTPNQIFIMEFKNDRWSGSGSATAPQQNFQVWLYETSNIIEFHYGAMLNGTSPSASIGLTGPVAGDYISVTPAAAPTASISSANNTIAVATFLTNGLVYRFAPPVPFYDMGVSALVSPLSPMCYGTTETVSVNVRNYGTGTIDLTVNPITVGGAVTGPNPATFGPVVLNTGTIAGGASQLVTFTTTYDMSAVGSYVFNATMSVAGDATTGNDAMTATTLLKTNPVVVSSSDITICSGSPTVITATQTPVIPPVTGTNSTNFAIPDNNPTGISSVINISGAGSANSVISVVVNITHAFDGDVDMTLIAPNGSQIDLCSDNGLAGVNFTNTTFVATGFPSITTGSAPFTGSFLPEQAFSTLTGSGSGNWRLRIVDDANLDIGNLISWSITLPSAAAIASYAWSPALGLSSTTVANPTASPLATTTYSVIATDYSGCTATENVIVSTNALPTASASSTAILCNGGTSAVTITAAGGLAPYTGEGTFTQSAGTTVYTVTDANSCNGTASVVITQPALLVATSSATPILCNGGGPSTVTISATGGTGPYIGTGTFTQSAGTTAYTVTDANACTSIVNVTVIEPAVLAATSSSTAILCNGGTSTVTVSATGGTLAYTGTGTFSQSAGTTVYTVTDANGCSTNTTVVATQPTALVATSSSTAILCNGGMSTVTVAATGGTGALTGTGTFTAPAGAYSYTVTDANSCTSATTGTITQPAAITVTPTSSTILCNGGTSTVTIAATGGTGTLTGTGTFTQSAGTTVYTVTDANFCAVTTSVVATQPSALVITPTSSAVLCNGAASTVTILASGGTSPYGGQGTFSQLAGTTVYTVTDANACATSTSIVVTEPTALVATSTSSAILCNGGTSTVTISVSGGTPSYSGTGPFTGLTGGPYSYTVTDANGCPATTTGTIIEPTAIVVSSSETGVLCNGGTSTVTVSATGGTPTYSGTGPQTPITAGPYSYTVTDANGCTSITSGTITEPTALMAMSSFTPITCNGGTSTVTISAMDGTPPYTAGVGSFSGVVAGPYSYTVTDANGCTSITSGTITEPTALVVATSSVTSVSCNGDCDGTATVGIVGGTGAITIDWTPGAPIGDGTGSITNLCAGTYTVVGTDASGCTTTATAMVAEPAAITTAQTVNFCGSGSVTVGTNTYTAAGTYTDILAAASTCDSTVTTTVTITTVDATTTVAGAAISANSATGTYLWLDCNAAYAPLSPSETNQVYNSTANGSYAVEVTDNGCVDTSACVVISTTGIDNNVANVLSVYPNPTMGQFNIAIANANIAELVITIVDIQGKEVFSSVDRNVNGSYNKQINLDEIANGLYYIKMNTGTEVKIQKLIVQ